MFDAADYYRSGFEADAGRGEVSAGREAQDSWWPFAKIKRGLKRQCDDVRELKSDRANDLRSLVATDRETGLKFVALMEHETGRRERPERIVGMWYAAGFEVHGGPRLLEAYCGEIENRLEKLRERGTGGVSFVESDDEQLFLFARPLIVGDFDPDFFRDQLDLYLTDLRATGYILYGRS